LVLKTKLIILIKLQFVVKAVDYGQISRDSYWDLIAAEINLPHEYFILIERINIINYINQLNKISLVNMNKQNELNEIIKKLNIINAKIIQEVIDTVEVDIYHSVKNILYYIIT
jgi:predicted transcriptional regulator